MKFVKKMGYKKLKILLLATDSISTRIIFNRINLNFEIENVIIEKKISLKIFIKNRYKKVGILRLIDQLFFIIFLNKILNYLSKDRFFYILNFNKLNTKEICTNKIINVKSANSIQTINLIKEKNPDIIIINGTRIISEFFLKNISAKVINIHAGITPYYRGVHGAYWAFVNNNQWLAGVTLHFVDSGIDTGNIISQIPIVKNKNDNFSTYPLLQLTEGIKLLEEFLSNTSNNLRHKPSIINSNIESKQWYHPGFLEYIYYRLYYGFK
jgi:folate-dependent phosphoribosylglycinamide formyltransferase PurN